MSNKTLKINEQESWPYIDCTNRGYSLSGYANGRRIISFMMSFGYLTVSTEQDLYYLFGTDATGTSGKFTVATQFLEDGSAKLIVTVNSESVEIAFTPDTAKLSYYYIDYTIYEHGTSTPKCLIRFFIGDNLSQSYILNTELTANDLGLIINGCGNSSQGGGSYSSYETSNIYKIYAYSIGTFVDDTNTDYKFQQYEAVDDSTYGAGFTDTRGIGSNQYNLNPSGSYSYNEESVCDRAFYDSEIISISSEESVSLLGSELAYDTLTANVKCEDASPSLLIPTDADGIKSSDDLIISGHIGTDIRATAYGVPVSLYIDDEIKGKFYVESVSRNSQYQYEISCVSVIGLLDKQNHHGNVYFGAAVSDVITEILGSSSTIAGTETTYSVDSDFGSALVYGWLPNDTRRNNLQQLLFATNGHVSKSNDGSVTFGYISDSTATEIDSSRVYESGSEEYQKQATQISVTEHSYFFNASVDEEKIYDNSSSKAVEGKWVEYSTGPINPSTVYGDGITVVSAGPNGATITGSGILYGKPYTHTTYNNVKSISSDGSDYEITVTDATLVSPANSENNAARLITYYSAPTIVKAGILYDGEKCSNKYSLTDAFYELQTGYLYKIGKTYSSNIKADCEFLADYSIGNNGNNYSHSVLLTSGTSYTIPSGVSKIRVILIGGGNGGQSGLAGKEGSGASGGTGGNGGTGGDGGKIYISDISVTAGGSYSYSIGSGGTGGSSTSSTSTHNNGSAGGNTTFASLSSANGSSYPYGIADIFSAYKIYAYAGFDGIGGANGGSTSESATSGGGISESRTFPDGTVETITQSGGSSGSTKIWNETASWIELIGGSGGGACATSSGASGSVGSVSITYHNFAGFNALVATKASGGNGASPSTASAGKIYGCGGCGGHGGGGGGGTGANNNSIFSYSEYVPGEGTVYFGDQLTTNEGTPGSGGNGGAGGNGMQGCIIIYY